MLYIRAPEIISYLITTVWTLLNTSWLLPSLSLLAYLLNTYYIPGIVLSSLHELLHFIVANLF